MGVMAESMASRYSSDYPPLAIDPSIPGFFETFYQISDTPDAHERYTDAFTGDALMVMASKQAKGREGLCLFCTSLLFLSVHPAASRSASPYIL